MHSSLFSLSLQMKGGTGGLEREGIQSDASFPRVTQCVGRRVESNLPVKSAFLPQELACVCSLRFSKSSASSPFPPLPSFAHLCSGQKEGKPGRAAERAKERSPGSKGCIPTWASLQPHLWRLLPKNLWWPQSGQGCHLSGCPFPTFNGGFRKLSTARILLINKRVLTHRESHAHISSNRY